MKVALFASLLALSSGSALACPHLTGAFDCLDDQGASEFKMLISQRQNRGVWSFKIQQDASGPFWEAIADGVLRDYQMSDGQPLGPQAYSCERSAALRMDTRDVDSDGLVMNTVVRFSLNAQSDLVQATDLSGDGFSPVHDERVCLRVSL